MIEDIRYRQSYAVFPYSMMKVDNIDQYEALAESYDYAPEYVINEVEQQEVQDVKDGVEQMVIEQPEQQVEEPAESQIESKEEDAETSQEDKQEDATSEVIESASTVLSALGIDLGPIQDAISNEAKKPENPEESQTHENC